MGKYTAIGGQALIEGIMMKSPEKTAIAVRTQSGEIDITHVGQKSLKDKYKFFSLPVIRGIVTYIESMKEGYKAMMISVDKSGFAEEEGEKEDKKSDSKLIAAVTAIGSVLGFALALVLFIYLPRLIEGGIERLAGVSFGAVVRSFIEQMIKLAVFVGYIAAVSLSKDIKRVFMYHGAEHKTIFCYEKGLEMTVENVKAQRRFHPRCGTSFLILMILVSMLFSILVQLICGLFGLAVYSIKWLWVLIKILLIPLICGAGYEILRACGKYDNVFTKIVSAPGLWLQRLTTKEPDDSMIEVAIAALRACEPERPDVDRSVDKTEKKDAEDEQNDI